MDYRDFRILAFRADSGGSGHYRISHPMTLLRRRGADVRLFDGSNPAFRLSPEDVDGAQIILVQRCQDPRFMESLRERKQENAVLVYEIDDNAHRTPPESHAYHLFKPGSERLRGIERCMRMADAVTVPTPELASQYAHLNERICVIPNFIDFSIRDWETPVPRDERLAGKLVIGWCGGTTHQGDYLPLQGVLRAILGRYEQVLFAICSNPVMMDEFCRELDLPEEKVVRLAGVPFDRYPTIPAQFDIGLAPLRDNAFNRCKSDLKLKEFGARGVPYVATDIAPYHRFHQETQGQGGYLASRAQEWEAALVRLIESGDERGSRSESIRRVVRERYDLDDHVDRWLAVPTSAREQACPGIIGTASKERARPGRNDPCPCDSGRKYKKCCIPAYG